MISFSVLEFMVICSSVFLVILLLIEILDWAQLFSWSETECRSPVFAFGYRSHNGPHTWKVLYPESNGSNQSPINITTRLAIVVQPSTSLQWKGYDAGPLSMTLSNDGNSVTISTIWKSFARPYIQGGFLTNTYDFHSASFHWGQSNDEGSEHTLDYMRYPMELQVLHVKRGLTTPLDASSYGIQDGNVIVSFFFQITVADNPYLDHIITNLWRVSRPQTKVHIPPFPLEWIFPSFEKNYYTYNGSFTRPPCSEAIAWIIHPEPIAISSSQVAEFRKVCSADGPILSNCRPVQRLNERDVYFYE